MLRGFSSQRLVMADTAITVESESDAEPSRSSVAQTNHQNGILMTHSHTPQSSSGPIRLGFNFNPMEDSRRIIAHNLSTIGEISPLINLSRSRPALSLQEWINPNHQRQVQSTSPISPENPSSTVINIENHEQNFVMENHQPMNNDHQHHSFTDNLANNIRETANGPSQNNNNNNNNSDGNSSVAISVEARATHKNLENYITFLGILLTKFIYENGAEILNFVLLVVTFIQANNDLKREILKQQNRSHMVLLGILCYIIGCFVFINFVFKEPIFFSYSPPKTISQLLWTVAVTDYVLKLITVAFKVLMTLLPIKILPCHKRGKYYLMIEAASQLYRCVAPLNPWFYYLYLVYNGPDKVLGIVLFLMYGVHKSGDFFSHIKFFFECAWKMLQNVSLGTSPTKEQIIAAGGICAICHEEYSTPVRLYCNHIFCEGCVTTWLDRERSCPLCRASITDDPIYRDGHTTHFVQLY
ncbi:RING finger and transmembrane domain-containing protein 2-like isoform X2 [Phymastichus coffea]|uniref:RING finger and transmembrane domain-containing protein 2-like isoform X2 n=1 Tax=Phymastichus coffea TaxID=108790 RepID=UPI00273A79E2|nr:RING finger and transmembrane domain-containing protein 2-like isoform X2 [Phymastichus coffea]XP_058810710.1 RING finger and transmembrane domain-containing protein 2-like isoform X2 [Phymastichus coffea]